MGALATNYRAADDHRTSCQRNLLAPSLALWPPHADRQALAAGSTNLRRDYHRQLSDLRMIGRDENACDFTVSSLRARPRAIPMQTKIAAILNFPKSFAAVSPRRIGTPSPRPKFGRIAYQSSMATVSETTERHGFRQWRARTPA